MESVSVLRGYGLATSSHRLSGVGSTGHYELNSRHQVFEAVRMMLAVGLRKYLHWPAQSATTFCQHIGVFLHRHHAARRAAHAKNWASRLRQRPQIIQHVARRRGCFPA